MLADILRWAHVLGATVLIGTGAGIAFFMVMAQRAKDPAIIAHVAKTVVIADWLFTASAVVLQPITGIWLALIIGWPLTEPWLLISICLYLVIGAFWLPVVWIQHKLWKLAETAARAQTDLPPLYHKLYRIWFVCGFPAFLAVLSILWLMLMRPGN